MEKLNDRWVHESELCDYARSENIECLFAYERYINPLCYFILSERIEKSSGQKNSLMTENYQENSYQEELLRS